MLLEMSRHTLIFPCLSGGPIHRPGIVGYNRKRREKLVCNLKRSSLVAQTVELMKRHAARPLAHAITQRTLVFRTKYAGQRLLSDRSGPQTTGPNEMGTQPLPEPDDPRPSWLFASSSFLRVLLIPSEFMLLVHNKS